jgi:hypothetical protein
MFVLSHSGTEAAAVLGPATGAAPEVAARRAAARHCRPLVDHTAVLLCTAQWAIRGVGFVKFVNMFAYQYHKYVCSVYCL